MDDDKARQDGLSAKVETHVEAEKPADSAVLEHGDTVEQGEMAPTVEHEEETEQGKSAPPESVEAIAVPEAPAAPLTRTFSRKSSGKGGDRGQTPSCLNFFSAAVL